MRDDGRLLVQLEVEIEVVVRHAIREQREQKTRALRKASYRRALCERYWLNSKYFQELLKLQEAFANTVANKR